jgi:hypothetical protein
MTKKSTKAQFVQKAKKIHGNDKWRYDKFIYINNSTKGIIMCQEHGSFPQSPANHLKGKGCPTCGNLNRGKSNSSNTEAFILKAKKIHGDTYDYTLVVYKGLKIPITIICPEHGPFPQTPDNHLQRQGCSKCGRKRRDDIHRSNTEAFIQKAKKMHNDKYDYTMVDYKNCKEKIIIICPEHGNFTQTPDGHLRERGCKKCAIKKNADNRRGNNESFIQKSRENTSCRDYNDEYYDYSLVKYKNAHTKVEIKCLYHNKIFKMIPNNHSHHGQKCPDCALIYAQDRMTDSPQDIIDKSNKKHNNNFEIKFNNDYTNSRSMINITCKKHQYSFINTVTNHLHYTFGGCEECATETRKIIKTDVEFKKDAIKVHGNKFKYHTEYTGSHGYLTIECKNGHIFKQSATSHLSGSGCRCCAVKINSDTQRYTHEDFLKKSSEVWGNNKYIYHSQYTGCKDYLIIECKKHNRLFNQIASSHLKGYEGCKSCSKGFAYSKIGCKWIEEEMKKNNIDIQYALSPEGEFKPIKGVKMHCDGYCKQTNTIYEFHGGYWHGDPKIYDQKDINPTTKKKFGTLFINTCMREKLYRDAGYKYKCIWETDYR